MDIQGMLIKGVCKKAGLDVDAPLPELIASANEAFDLGLTVTQLEAQPVAIVDALASLTRTIEQQLVLSGAQFYQVTADKNGRVMAAFVVLGGASVPADAPAENFIKNA